VLKKTPEQYPHLEKMINIAIADLETHDPDSAEYARITDQIVKLNDVLNGNKPKKTAVSKDVWVSAGVNILGILLVISKESIGAVTSKSYSMIKKI